MSLDPKKLREINKILKDIEKSYKILGEKNPFEGISPEKLNLDDLKDSLKEATEYINLLDTNASDIFKSFKAITEEVGNNNKAYSSASKSLGSLTSISAQLRDNQLDINNLSSKQLKSLSSRISSETANLRVSQQLLESKLREGTISDKERVMLSNINGLLDEKDSTLKSLNKTALEELELRQKIDKQLGIAGGLLKGISKIPILGDIFDANEAIKEMEDNLKTSNSPVKALGAGFQNIGKQIVDGVLNPANLILGVFTFMVNTLKNIDGNAGDFAKQMNTSYSEALSVREEMAQISTLSNDVALNSERLMTTQMEVGKALGTNARLNESDLKTMTKLVQQSGFQYDELMNIQKLSLTNGKSLEQNTKAILGGAKAYASRNKIVVNEKEVLKEVNNSSKSLQLSLGQNTKALAESVVKAKQFGLNLEEAERIASSLLDFESSIENELSAELLTGKNLNFEKARQLSLEGDIAGAAAEVAKQMGSTKDFGKMNVIQQEAIAKSIGMSREDLAKSLIEKEALTKVGAKDAEEARKKYDSLVQQYGVEEAQKRLGDEALATQFQQQNVQEQFTQGVDKMKDIFVSLTPTLEIIGGFLSSFFEIVSLILTPIQLLNSLFKTIGDKISGFIGPLGKVGKILKGLASLAVVFAAYKAYASLASIPVVGVPLGIAAAAAVTSAGFGLLGSIKDGVIDPKGGIVVSGEKGSIQLDKDDSIIAGTNLFDKNKKSESSPSSPQVKIDMGPTNALLQQLINVISAGGDVMLDGQKVGQALNLIAYKTQ